MSINPCYKDGVDCPRRAAGCAVGCKDWAAYRAERDAELQRQYAERQARAVGVEYHIRAKLNYLRKRR